MRLRVVGQEAGSQPVRNQALIRLGLVRVGYHACVYLPFVLSTDGGYRVANPSTHTQNNRLLLLHWHDPLGQSGLRNNRR